MVNWSTTGFAGPYIHTKPCWMKPQPVLCFSLRKRSSPTIKSSRPAQRLALPRDVPGLSLWNGPEIMEWHETTTFSGKLPTLKVCVRLPVHFRNRSTCPMISLHEIIISGHLDSHHQSIYQWLNGWEMDDPSITIIIHSSSLHHPFIIVPLVVDPPIPQHGKAFLEINDFPRAGSPTMATISVGHA